MMSISLGPFALPTAPLLVLLCTLLVALAVARLAHVSLHLDAYRAEPWTLLDVRDGGWNTAAGLLGGAGWMAWQAWRHPAWRRALATGQPVRLRDVAARGPIVVNLWASWCGPCRREMPVLAAAQARHPEVTFILVNQGEQAETVRHYLDAQRLGLSGVLLDTGSRLGPALGSGGLPTTVFFDHQGRRVDAHMGALNGAALATRLNTLSTQRTSSTAP